MTADPVQYPVGGLEQFTVSTGILLLLAAFLVLVFFRFGWKMLRGTRPFRQYATRRLAGVEWKKARRLYDGAVYLIGLDDRLVCANQAFYDFVGRTAREARGSHIMNLVHGAREKELCPVCRARRERRDAVFIKPSDDPMNRTGQPIGIIVKILRDPEGEAVGVLQVLQKLVAPASEHGRLEHSAASVASASTGSGPGVPAGNFGHAAFLSTIEQIFNTGGAEPSPPPAVDELRKPDHERKLLALKVRMLRLSHQWSQEDLALEAGLDAGSVGAIEHARQHPNPDAVEKLAIAFGLKAEDLSGSAAATGNE